jgi:CBS domain-containing protein
MATSVGRICTREVIVVSPGDSVRDAACLMDEKGVGTVVVLDGEKRPVGILSDRDVALRCVAGGRDPESTRIADVMSQPALSVPESTSIEAALRRMAGAHARRLVVVDGGGRLAGLLALSDVLDLLVEESTLVGKILARAGPPQKR